MLREYTSIPKKCLACRIEETGKVEKVKEGTAVYKNKVGAIQEVMEFQYPPSSKPEPGDYIVKEGKSDQYLVKRAQFEREYRSSGFKLH